MATRLTKARIRRWHTDTEREVTKLVARQREARTYRDNAKGGRASALTSVIRSLNAQIAAAEDTQRELDRLVVREGVELA